MALYDPENPLEPQEAEEEEGKRTEFSFKPMKLSNVKSGRKILKGLQLVSYGMEDNEESDSESGWQRNLFKRGEPQKQKVEPISADPDTKIFPDEPIDIEEEETEETGIIETAPESLPTEEEPEENVKEQVQEPNDIVTGHPIADDQSDGIDIAAEIEKSFLELEEKVENGEHKKKQKEGKIEMDSSKIKDDAKKKAKKKKKKKKHHRSDEVKEKKKDKVRGEADKEEKESSKKLHKDKNGAMKSKGKEKDAKSDDGHERGREKKKKKHRSEDKKKESRKRQHKSDDESQSRSESRSRSKKKSKKDKDTSISRERKVSESSRNQDIHSGIRRKSPLVIKSPLRYRNEETGLHFKLKREHSSSPVPRKKHKKDKPVEDKENQESSKKRRSSVEKGEHNKQKKKLKHASSKSKSSKTEKHKKSKDKTDMKDDKGKSHSHHEKQKKKRKNKLKSSEKVSRSRSQSADERGQRSWSYSKTGGQELDSDDAKRNETDSDFPSLEDGIKMTKLVHEFEEEETKVTHDEAEKNEIHEEPELDLNEIILPPVTDKYSDVSDKDETDSEFDRLSELEKGKDIDDEVRAAEMEISDGEPEESVVDISEEENATNSELVENTDKIMDTKEDSVKLDDSVDGSNKLPEDQGQTSFKLKLFGKVVEQPKWTPFTLDDEDEGPKLWKPETATEKFSNSSKLVKPVPQTDDLKWKPVSEVDNSKDSIEPEVDLGHKPETDFAPKWKMFGNEAIRDIEESRENPPSTELKEAQDDVESIEEGELKSSDNETDGKDERENVSLEKVGVGEIDEKQIDSKASKHKQKDHSRHRESQRESKDKEREKHKDRYRDRHRDKESKRDKYDSHHRSKKIDKGSDDEGYHRKDRKHDDENHHRKDRKHSQEHDDEKLHRKDKKRRDSREPKHDREDRHSRHRSETPQKSEEQHHRVKGETPKKNIERQYRHRSETPRKDEDRHSKHKGETPKKSEKHKESKRSSRHSDRSPDKHDTKSKRRSDHKERHHEEKQDQEIVKPAWKPFAKSKLLEIQHELETTGLSKPLEKIEEAKPKETEKIEANTDDKLSEMENQSDQESDNVQDIVTNITLAGKDENVVTETEHVKGVQQMVSAVPASPASPLQPLSSASEEDIAEDNLRDDLLENASKDIAADGSEMDIVAPLLDDTKGNGKDEIDDNAQISPVKESPAKDVDEEVELSNKQRTASIR